MQEAELVAAYLREHGVQASHGLLDDELLRRRVKQKEFDLLVALGGDGTMLRAGHLCGPTGIPILGINLGRFGFLAEMNQDQWRSVLPRLFEDDDWLEVRFR